MISKSFSFLDPFRESKEQSLLYFKKFNKFIGEVVENSRPYHLNPIKHAIQKDAYNCGIYILEFAKRLINNNNLEEIFNPDFERENIMHLLLDMSLDILKTCMFCRQNIPDNSANIQCTSCKRSFHIKCLNTSF